MSKSDKKSKTDKVMDSAVLVTGGSGFVGRSVVRRLAEKGNTVVSMYHHRLPEPMANVYPVCSDMGSSELIAAPLRGVNAVVHLAWAGNFVGSSEKIEWTLEPAKLSENVKLLRNLILAMERAGTRRIVFLSAIGANKNASTPFLQEKYLAEFFILNSRIPEKIILRSSVVYGADINDRFLRSIIKVMRLPGIYPVPSAKEKLAPVYIEDLVETVIKSSTEEVNSGSVLLELAGEEKYKIDELFKIVSNRFSKGAKLPIKGPFGNALLPFFERDKKRDPNGPRLRHFLSIGNSKDESISLENPLKLILPSKYRSFSEVISEGQGS